MSDPPTYPGVVIDEAGREIAAMTPAPTSIAAFVGYTHRWKTQSFDRALPLSGFADYEAQFGGLYASDAIRGDVARAVHAFFANGGTEAWVVGLQPAAHDASGNRLGTFGLPSAGGLAATATIDQLLPTSASGFTVTALEPVDVVPMTVSIVNVRQGTLPASTADPYDTFDLVVAYGARTETFSDLGIGASSGTRPDIAINGTSSLIVITPPEGGAYGTGFAGNGDGAGPSPIVVAPTLTIPGFATSESTSDFAPVFEPGSALDAAGSFNLLLIPGTSAAAIVDAVLAYAERKNAFAILDPPAGTPASGSDAIDTVVLPQSEYGALYFPYLRATDPVTGGEIAVAPGGHVAGILARNDAAQGVWKSPAGVDAAVTGVLGPVADGIVDDARQTALGGTSINCLRAFAGVGTVVFGARTLAWSLGGGEPDRYVPVRRTMAFIEQTVTANLQWAVFEPNDETLWSAIRGAVGSFMTSLFRQGALQGTTPATAFLVRCDGTTTTEEDIAAGIVHVLIGVALMKPAEFVFVTIAQVAGQTS